VDLSTSITAVVYTYYIMYRLGSTYTGDGCIILNRERNKTIENSVRRHRHRAWAWAEHPPRKVIKNVSTTPPVCNIIIIFVLSELVPHKRTRRRKNAHFNPRKRPTRLRLNTVQYTTMKYNIIYIYRCIKLL